MIKHDISRTPSNLHVEEEIDGCEVAAKLNVLERLLLL